MVDAATPQVDIDPVVVDTEQILEVPGLKPDMLIIIISACLGLSLLGEVITWFMIYRHDEYK